MGDDGRDPIAFPRFFDPVDLGRSLREVATDVIATTHHDVISRWLHSPKDADLFLWFERESNALIKQQVSFYGQVVEWNCVEGLRTGLVIESETGRVKASETVRFDQRAQPGPVRQALQLVAQVTALPESERAMIIARFQNPEPNAGAWSPTVVARPRTAGWWARLRAFFGRR